MVQGALSVGLKLRYKVCIFSDITYKLVVHNLYVVVKVVHSCRMVVNNSSNVLPHHPTFSFLDLMSYCNCCWHFPFLTSWATAIAENIFLCWPHELLQLLTTFCECCGDQRCKHNFSGNELNKPIIYSMACYFLNRYVMQKNKYCLQNIMIFIIVNFIFYVNGTSCVPLKIALLAS